MDEPKTGTGQINYDEMKAFYEKHKHLQQRDNWQYDFLCMMEYHLLVVERSMFKIEKLMKVFEKTESNKTVLYGDRSQVKVQWED